MYLWYVEKQLSYIIVTAGQGLESVGLVSEESACEREFSGLR